MSNRTLKRAGRAGVALAVGCAFAAVPLSAQAATATVNLGNAEPFSVLAGSTVTGNPLLPSTMWGNLGLHPGSSVTGNPTVGGAMYISDAAGVALNAKNSLTAAYTNADGRPTSGPAGSGELSGQVFKSGVYTATSQLLLSAGSVTLDAENDPGAVFIFQVGSDLTTLPGTSVVLTNRANPCNVFWQVSSSATLGVGTSFVGTVMADQSITDDGGSTVNGRLLARIGAVNLNNTNIIHSACTPTDDDTTDGIPGGTGGTGGSGGSGGSGGTTPATGAPAGSTPAAQAPPASRSATPTRNGTARLRRPPTTTTSRRPPANPCTDGFQATVRGKLIKRVVFSLDGKRIGTRTKPAFRVWVRASGGMHAIKARVTFKDATRAKTLKFRYRACAAQELQPRRGPSQFTG